VLTSKKHKYHHLNVIEPGRGNFQRLTCIHCDGSYWTEVVGQVQEVTRPRAHTLHIIAAAEAATAAAAAVALVQAGSANPA
jgi:hypothetical protein